MRRGIQGKRNHPLEFKSIDFRTSYLIVFRPDTVVEPNAVMVEAGRAFVAETAVLCELLNHTVAYLTIIISFQRFVSIT